MSISTLGRTRSAKRAPKGVQMMLFEVRPTFPWERLEPRASAKGGVVSRLSGEYDAGRFTWPAKMTIEGVGEVEFIHTAETPVAAAKRWRVLTAAASVGMLKAALIRAENGLKVSFMVDPGAVTVDRLLTQKR